MLIKESLLILDSVNQIILGIFGRNTRILAKNQTSFVENKW